MARSLTHVTPRVEAVSAMRPCICPCGMTARVSVRCWHLSSHSSTETNDCAMRLSPMLLARAAPYTFH